MSMRKFSKILSIASLLAILSGPLSVKVQAAATLTDLDCIDGIFSIDISGASSISAASVSKSSPAQTVSFAGGSLGFSGGTLTITPNDSELSQLESFGYNEMSFSVTTNAGTVTGGCSD